MKIFLVLVMVFSSLCFSQDLISKKVYEIQFSKSLRLGGTLKSVNEGYISTRFSGYIETLHVKVGDRVKKGELLVSIDPIQRESLIESSKANLTRAKAALSQTKANYIRAKNEEKTSIYQANDAKQNFKRYSSLYEDNVVSKRNFEEVKLDMDVKNRLVKVAKQRVLQAKSAVDEAQASVESLEVNLKQSSNSARYYELKAKFDGIVTEKLKKEYELASPGEKILHIASLFPLELSLDVPAKIFRILKINQEVKLYSNLFETPKLAKVKTLVPYAKEGTHSYEVKLESYDTNLLPGLYVEAKIKIPFEKFISIEPSMLAFRGGIAGVFVKKNDVLNFKPVHVKIQEADKLGVIGIDMGEEVIIYPPVNLKDGMKAL